MLGKGESVVVGEYHRFLIASTLRYLDFIEGEITYLKKAVGERLGSFTKLVI